MKSILKIKTNSFLETYKKNLFSEAMWKVEVEGFPPFYMDGSSAGEVKMNLKKKLKKPKEIKSIERIQKTDWKKNVMDRISGKEIPVDESEVQVKQWIKEDSLTDDLLIDAIKNVMKERIKNG
jgi:predicted transcriptional regulator